MNATKTTWEQVMSMKSSDTRHDGVANTLTKDEITTILAVVDFFGGSVAQVHLDLAFCRFRVFDWLAMGVMSAREDGGGRMGSKHAVKVLAHSFLKSRGDIDEFINDLRVSDYQVDEAWEGVEL
jgi:hypothetical protein